MLNKSHVKRAAVKWQNQPKYALSVERSREDFQNGLGIIGLIWAISDGIGGVGDSGGNSAVKIIKESSLGMCPNKTVGQMVSGYFGSPKWSSGKSQGNADIKDGQILVNVKGKISYMDKPVDAVLQFKFSEDGQNFEVQALEINGLPQNAFMITGLLENMCKK